jgi:hypothetical protein
MATKGTGSSTRKKAAGTKAASKKPASKKPASKESTATTSTSRQAAGKRTTSKKTAGKKTAVGSDGRSSAPRAESRPTPSATELARSAARDLLELTGKQPEGITGLERTDDGWTVQVEVVEVSRIPNTTDVLAVYEITTDDRGQLQGYRRLRRYARGVPGEE